jgi:hypothetical protein
MKNPFQYIRRRTEIVEAVQYKSESFEGSVILPVWILQAIRDGAIRTTVGALHCGNKEISEGDYIVKNEDGKIFLLTKGAFEARYERPPEAA